MKVFYSLMASALLLVATGTPLLADDARAERTRPGYMVVIGEGVDPAGMADYAKAAVPLLLQAGGVLMFTTEEGQTEVIEGPPS